MPEEEKEDDVEKSYKDKLDTLTTAFGSLKKRRAMEKRLRNTLTSETLQSAVGDAVDVTLGGENVGHVLNEANIDRTSQQLPPYNLEANTPEEAYPLSERELCFIPFKLLPL